MNTPNWTTVELGRLHDEERRREAARERLARQAGPRRMHVSVLLHPVVSAFGHGVAAIGAFMHRHAIYLHGLKRPRYTA